MAIALCVQEESYEEEKAAAGTRALGSTDPAKESSFSDVSISHEKLAEHSPRSSKVDTDRHSA